VQKLSFQYDADHKKSGRQLGTSRKKQRGQSRRSVALGLYNSQLTVSYVCDWWSYKKDDESIRYQWKFMSLQSTEVHFCYCNLDKLFCTDIVINKSYMLSLWSSRDNFIARLEGSHATWS